MHCSKIIFKKCKNYWWINEKCEIYHTVFNTIFLQNKRLALQLKIFIFYKSNILCSCLSLLSSQRIATLYVIKKHFISTYFIAWVNSLHFVMPPLVSPQNDIWGMGIEIPYWWRITTYIWVVLLIGWKFASTNHKHYPDLGSDVLSFLFYIILLTLPNDKISDTTKKSVHIFTVFNRRGHRNNEHQLLWAQDTDR